MTHIQETRTPREFYASKRYRFIYWSNNAARPNYLGSRATLSNAEPQQILFAIDAI